MTNDAIKDRLGGGEGTPTVNKLLTERLQI